MILTCATQIAWTTETDLAAIGASLLVPLVLWLLICLSHGNKPISTIPLRLCPLTAKCLLNNDDFSSHIKS